MTSHISCKNVTELSSANLTCSVLRLMLWVHLMQLQSKEESSSWLLQIKEVVKYFINHTWGIILGPGKESGGICRTTPEVTGCYSTMS